MTGAEGHPVCTCESLRARKIGEGAGEVAWPDPLRSGDSPPLPRLVKCFLANSVARPILLGAVFSLAAFFLPPHQPGEKRGRLRDLLDGRQDGSGIAPLQPKVRKNQDCHAVLPCSFPGEIPSFLRVFLHPRPPAVAGSRR